jgi:hypothetical protein
MMIGTRVRTRVHVYACMQGHPDDDWDIGHAKYRPTTGTSV